MTSKLHKGFTIVEILITVTILALVAATTLALINPWKQINKAQDAKRKSDLQALKKALEDWYNDKGCYPKPEDICYTDPIAICAGNLPKAYTVSSITCSICGTSADSPSFSPYLSPLPCDSLSPKQDYLYNVESVGVGTTNPYCSADPSEYVADCPSWYRIYSNLQNDEDPAIADIGCQAESCGPARPPAPTLPYGYDYGASSPNITFDASTDFVCYTDTPGCDACGERTYQSCIDDPGCPHKDKIYATTQACQTANGL